MARVGEVLHSLYWLMFIWNRSSIFSLSRVIFWDWISLRWLDTRCLCFCCWWCWYSEIFLEMFEIRKIYWPFVAVAAEMLWLFLSNTDCFWFVICLFNGCYDFWNKSFFVLFVSTTFGYLLTELPAAWFATIVHTSFFFLWAELNDLECWLRASWLSC